MSTYTVRRGDTLGAIAGKYHTSVSSLAHTNHIANPNLIYVGEKLTVPGAAPAKPKPPVHKPAPKPPAHKPAPKPAPKPVSYTVRSGDTLGGIAARFHSSVSSIASANHIKNANLIYVGQHLTIPGTHAPTPVKPAPAPGPTKGGISLGQLHSIMPNLSDSRARQMLPYLNQAMVSGKINTPKRQAAFLAQLAHESGELRYMEEIASGAAYEGRRDLGNTQPGDGRRFKGRGPIQLTGRANYRAAGRALGLNLEGHPEQVATPAVGFKVAVWFWNSHNLSHLADSKSFDAITRAINGGYNGKASRDAYYRRALNVLHA